MPNNLHHAQEYLRQELGPNSLGGKPGVSIEFVSSIEDAVRDADLAIDCVPDELESKLEIFCLLDRMAPPRTIFATPTTRLSIADLANCTYRPERCVAIDLEAAAFSEGSILDIPLRTTSRTRAEVQAFLKEFWTALGFVPTFAADPAESQTVPG